jgi:hypothetical protein
MGGIYFMVHYIYEALASKASPIAIRKINHGLKAFSVKPGEPYT